MYQKFYTQFLKNFEGGHHFAAHSHHFWPDVTKEAQEQYWLDSSRLADNKWNHFFEEIVPKTKKHIANILNFSRPNDISFASNTHELAFRLFSSLNLKKEIKVLTTNSEFHSFNRQITRLSEMSNINVFKVAPENLIDALTDSKFDFIFISQAFFNTSEVLDWNTIEELVSMKGDAIFCVDGYHAFGAVPTDISKIEDKIFYLAGGYKYAQGGEGVCFMTNPAGCDLRPLNTGWFASFSSLESGADQVSYDDYGMRFWGSTLDMTAFYRFNATWDLFESENINVKAIHNYIQTLQAHWIKNFEGVCPGKLVNTDLSKTGHFICYEFESNDAVKEYYNIAKSKGVLFDYRNRNLRIGLGMYHSIESIDDAIGTLKS